MMKRPTILLATLLAMDSAIVATAQAQEVWGAVATDNERLFGVATGMATRGGWNPRWPNADRWTQDPDERATALYCLRP